MRHHQPTLDQSDARPHYPAASIMRHGIGKPFEGLDIEGHQVSGRVHHVGNYGPDGQPTRWVLLLETGHTAIITNKTLQAHLDGLAFCASMKNDNE